MSPGRIVMEAFIVWSTTVSCCSVFHNFTQRGWMIFARMGYAHLYHRTIRIVNVLHSYKREQY